MSRWACAAIQGRRRPLTSGFLDADLEFRAGPGGRIRKDLEPRQDRVLDQSILEERRTPVADVVVDRVDALGDALQDELADCLQRHWGLWQIRTGVVGS
jgi:hypothetical protein